MELECDENYNLCSDTNDVTKVMEDKDHEKETKSEESLSHQIQDVNNPIKHSRINGNQPDSTTTSVDEQISKVEIIQADKQEKEIVENVQETVVETQETVVETQEAEKKESTHLEEEKEIDIKENENATSKKDNDVDEEIEKQQQGEQLMDTTSTVTETEKFQISSDCHVELNKSPSKINVEQVEITEETQTDNQNVDDHDSNQKEEEGSQEQEHEEEESMEVDDDTSTEVTESSTTTTTSATDTTDAVKSSEKEKNEILVNTKVKKIENPGSIFNWRESISENRRTAEIDKIIDRRLDFFCDAAEQSDSYLVSLETCPTQFFSYHCVKAMNLSINHLFTRAINMVWKLKALLQLYPTELEQQNYDIEGFHYLLDSTIHHIMTEKSKVKDEDGDDDDEVLIEDFDTNNERWNELSLKSQSTILASKMYYLMLVNQPIKEIQALSNKVLENCQDVAEFFCMDCKIKSRKRKESSLPILKPKKLEMKSLLKAIELEPANPMVWTLMLETLFDFMRTDDRRPKIVMLGKSLQSVDHIQHFFHKEFQELLKIDTCIPKYLLLDIYILGANFYGYRNLRKEAVWKQDKSKSLSKNLKDAKEYIRKNHQKNILNALAIHPSSWKANLSIAFNHLRKFERDKALKALELGLKEDPLNVTLVLVYIRTLIGGTADQITQAFNNINEAITIAKNMNWPILAQTHLYFLSGCVSWMNGNLDDCLSNWMHGFHLSKPHFLSQFFFWSKNQIRKYLWPDTFTNFEVVENLKIQLRNLEVDSLIDEETREAATAFLSEIEELFPLTSSINKELRKLKKKWYYLFELPNQDSDSDSDSEDEVKIVDDSVEVIELHSENEEEEEETVNLYSDILVENNQEEEKDHEVIDLDSDEEKQEEEGSHEEPIRISLVRPQGQDHLQPSDVDMEIEVSTREDSIPLITLDEDDDEPEEIEMAHVDEAQRDDNDEESEVENIDDDEVVEVETSQEVTQIDDDEEGDLNYQNVENNESDVLVDNEESEKDISSENNYEEVKNGHISEEIEEHVTNIVEEEVMEKTVIISELISNGESTDREKETINHSQCSLNNNNSKTEKETEPDVLEKVENESSKNGHDTLSNGQNCEENDIVVDNN